MPRTLQPRKIVRIDPDKCNGCGLCVPSCAEGAIQIVNGKAVLRAENLCDGLGNCLGECPQGAITIEQRPAEAFDEQAVERRLGANAHKPEPARAAAPPAAPAHTGGCPGMRMRLFGGGAGAKAAAAESHIAAPAMPSRLGHWPVQLHLLPERGPLWEGADVLLAADCVAYALADFHERLLAGKTLAIACPKLDDAGAYLDKLTRIFRDNSVRSVTVVRMEVPCCLGLTRIAQMALQAAGRADVEFTEQIVSTDGNRID